MQRSRRNNARPSTAGGRLYHTLGYTATAGLHTMLCSCEALSEDLWGFDMASPGFCMTSNTSSRGPPYTSLNPIHLHYAPKLSNPAATGDNLIYTITPTLYRHAHPIRPLPPSQESQTLLSIRVKLPCMAHNTEHEAIMAMAEMRNERRRREQAQRAGTKRRRKPSHRWGSDPGCAYSASNHLHNATEEVFDWRRTGAGWRSPHRHRHGHMGRKSDAPIDETCEMCTTRRRNFFG